MMFDCALVLSSILGQCGNVKMMSSNISSPFSFAKLNFCVEFWGRVKHTHIPKKYCPPYLLTGIVKLLVRIGREGELVTPSSRQTSIGIMMYLRCCSFRRGEMNGLTPDDLASRALYSEALLIYQILKCLMNSPIYKRLFL